MTDRSSLPSLRAELAELESKYDALLLKCDQFAAEAAEMRAQRDSALASAASEHRLAARLEKSRDAAIRSSSPGTTETGTRAEDAEDEIARLRVALDVAADGLRSAAKYLRYVNAFAFAEQVEIDEKHARAALPVSRGRCLECADYRASVIVPDAGACAETDAGVHQTDSCERWRRASHSPGSETPRGAEAVREDLLPSGRCASCHSLPGSCFCLASPPPSETPRGAEAEDERGPMTWGVSTDEESFHGHYATKEEALAAAASELDLEPGQRFWVGGGRLWRPSFSVDADQLFDRLAEHAGDECGEIAEDWLSAVSRADSDALEGELHAVVIAWLKRTGNLPGFYCCEVTEAHVHAPAPGSDEADARVTPHNSSKEG